MNRPAAMSSQKRRVQKLVGKSTWFKKPAKATNPGKRKKQQEGGPPQKRAKPESVLFVAHTPNSDLKQRLQRAEDLLMAGEKFGRLWIVERGGDLSLIHI